MRAVTSQPTTQEVRTAIPAHEQAPAIGRGLLDGFRDRLSDRDLRKAQLLMSELMTDAVRHNGADRIDVVIRGSRDELRAEVVGAGSGLRGMSSNGSSHEGWGSLILDRVADAWGVDERDGRTAAWFLISPLQS